MKFDIDFVLACSVNLVNSLVQLTVQFTQTLDINISDYVNNIIIEVLFPSFVLYELSLHNPSLLANKFAHSNISQTQLVLAKILWRCFSTLLLSESNFFKLKLFVAYFRWSDTILKFIFPFKFLYLNKTKKVC